MLDPTLPITFSVSRLPNFFSQPHQMITFLLFHSAIDTVSKQALKIATSVPLQLQVGHASAMQRNDLTYGHILEVHRYH